LPPSIEAEPPELIAELPPVPGELPAEATLPPELLAF
jgi:hypothetical protein